MERAGRAVAQACADLCGGTYGRRALVLAGKGNNGGDGFVAARHLARRGMRVNVVTLLGPSALGGLAAANAARLEEVAVRSTTFSEAALARALARADVVVDAVFGTGFRGMPEGDWAAAIEAVNATTVPVVAVDVPSGVDADTGTVSGGAVRATLTVTFGAAKTGVVLLPAAEHAGTVRVADIGSPDELIDADVFLTEPGDVAASLPVRAIDGHKRDAVLLVVAGSRGMTGAPGLVAAAGARMGAGLVHVAVPKAALAAIQAKVTEATFLPLAETSGGTLSASAVEAVLDAAARADAVAIGPGLAGDQETEEAIRRIVAACPVPLVVDADGLNAYAGDAFGLADRRAAAVLTPHAGELSRLTGVRVAELEGDRIRHIRHLAEVTQAVSLLKGSRTVIAAQDGMVRINVTGSPALATAGTGDVLTGMIGALLARGLAPMEAAASAAYLHGLAGTMAGRLRADGTLASDLLPLIPEAVARVEADS